MYARCARTVCVAFLVVSLVERDTSERATKGRPQVSAVSSPAVTGVIFCMHNCTWQRATVNSYSSFSINAHMAADSRPDFLAPPSVIGPWPHATWSDINRGHRNGRSQLITVLMRWPPGRFGPADYAPSTGSGRLSVAVFELMCARSMPHAMPSLAARPSGASH